MSVKAKTISVENANSIATHLKAILDHEQAPLTLKRDISEAVNNLFNMNETDTAAISDSYFNIRNTLLAHGGNGDAIAKLETVSPTCRAVPPNWFSKYEAEVEIIDHIMYADYQKQAEQEYDIAQNLLLLFGLIERSYNPSAAVEDLSTYLYYHTADFFKAVDRFKKGEVDSTGETEQAAA